MNLAVQNVDFSYGKLRLFENFTTSFDEGINILIGSNGSGKTTLMKMLAGIYQPKEGFIALGDKKYSEYQDIRKHISYLPQEFSVYQEMKVKDFLCFIAEIKLQKKAKYLQTQISDAIEMADIGDFVDKKIKALSGGMKKRVGIAQAIVSQADIIIADEPTAALDPEQCELFNRILQKISTGRIIITSTHIIQDIYADCDKLYVLSEGRQQYVGSLQNLKQTLDQKIFKISKGQVAQLDQTKIKLLGDIEESGEQYVKLAVLSDEALSDDLEPCSYTSADIWRYFK